MCSFCDWFSRALCVCEIGHWRLPSWLAGCSLVCLAGRRFDCVFVRVKLI